MSSLYEEKIIKSYSNGAGKKTYYARVSIGAGKKQSFIKISKEVFEAIVDDTFENGVITSRGEIFLQENRKQDVGIVERIMECAWYG